MLPQSITMNDIIQKYQTVLFDAFGVLVDAKGPLPYAIQLIDELNTLGKSYYILTNGARYSLQVSAQKYLERGLNIPSERVISSGSLLEFWIQKHQLSGKKCYVMGPQSSKDYIRSFGVEVVDLRQDFEAMILADQGDLQFPDDVDQLISILFRKLQQNENLPLVLPNPDIIYPSQQDCFGVTSGAIAMMIEGALKARFPDKDFVFEKLGKPFLPIFERALQVSGSRNMILIGDQITTDIAGAHAFGIDSALIATGVINPYHLDFNKVVKPTYLLKDLKLFQ